MWASPSPSGPASLLRVSPSWVRVASEMCTGPCTLPRLPVETCVLIHSCIFARSSLRSTVTLNVARPRFGPTPVGLLPAHPRGPSPTPVSPCAGRGELLLHLPARWAFLTPMVRNPLHVIRGAASAEAVVSGQVFLLSAEAERMLGAHQPRLSPLPSASAGWRLPSRGGPGAPHVSVPCDRRLGKSRVRKCALANVSAPPH